MIGCSDVPGGQTLVHHLQQRRVLQSSCDSFFVCQLFVHCTDTRREINYITHSQRTSSRLWLDVFCYLLPLRRESQEWCGHRSEWETEKHTKFRQQNINILYDALYMVTNSQRREMLKVHPSNHLTHTHTYRHMYLEPVRQGAQQLDFDWQADERRHAAVGDCGSELNAHSALCIVNLREKTNR